MFGIKFTINDVDPKFNSTPFRPTTVCDVKTREQFMLSGNNLFYQAREDGVWKLIGPFKV